MTDSEMKVALYCSECRSNNVAIPADATDETVIVCGDCGKNLGTWANIHAGIAEAAAQSISEDLQSILRETLKGSDVIRFEE
jgi:hypothetical protein